MNELVSIIMPSYNTARFISKTIESVLEQTYKNWELLIVDDCSTDNTDEIVSKYNKQTFVWQNTVSRAAYGNKHREEDGNMAFSKLITSYQSKGYDPNSLFIVDKDMRLLDGNHRMGMNLYTDQHKINVRVLKRKSKNPGNLDWYLQKKISADFLKKVYNAYLQIQEWLIETGDTFCCIVPENEKLSELDLMVNIKSVHRYRLQSPLFVGGA